MTRTLQEVLDSAEALADAAEAHVPTSAQERDPGSWHALRAAVASRTTAEDDVTRAVQAMRAEHYSWATIGGLLGTSPQAAQQRYGRHAKDKDLPGSAKGGDVHDVKGRTPRSRSSAASAAVSTTPV